MSKHNFGYFIHEGVSNMFSHGFMSFAAIGITVACLLKDLERENEMLAFVEEDFAEPKNLQKKLEAIPNVASVTFISRQQAMEKFLEDYPEEEMFRDLDPEILRDRFSLKILNLEQISQTKAAVKAVDGIADVNAAEEVAGGFITLRNVATVVCVALIAILFLVSVFIISNTIRLTTFDRREEIAIMRMVGATNGFIRWPFVYEGFLMGFLGASVAFLMEWGLYEAVARGVSTSDALQLIDVIPFKELWVPVAGSFAGAGIFIGVGGSLSAIRKYLQV